MVWAGQAVAEPDVAAGAAFAAANCGVCHALGASGDSPEMAAPPFRLLSRRYPVEHLAEALAEGIFVGHDAMPEFELDARQIADLLAWLAAIQQP